MKESIKEEAIKLALEDFDKFCAYSGANMNKMIACKERAKGSSLGKIALKLGKGKSTIQRMVSKCKK